MRYRIAKAAAAVVQEVSGTGRVPFARPFMARAIVPVAMSLLIAGCASVASAPGAPASSAPPLPRTAEPPAPAVNLSGFPLAYRQGYADGCASSGGTERKDAERYAADGNYRTGWQDGVALCRRK